MDTYEENSNASSASSTTGSSNTPAIPANYHEMSAKDRRFEYLLKQTELFSHFVGNNATKSTSPLKLKQKPNWDLKVKMAIVFDNSWETNVSIYISVTTTFGFVFTVWANC